MADQDDVIRMQLEIEDAEKADDLRASISLLEQKLGALYQQYKGHPDAFRKATEQDAAKLADLRAELDLVVNAKKREVEAAKQAARDKAQAAKDAAAAAKQAAREEAQAAKAAADVIVDAAHEEMAARRQAAAASTPAAGPTRLVGADRTAAKAQLGLAGANILQDAIQGGPASTINNFLGLAGNGNIRALAGEYLALAGGIAGVTAALGTFAAVAGSAFLLIDTGLKNAKLEWSDLDDVAANTAPFRAVSETIEGIGVVLKEAGITAAFDSAYDAAESFVGSIADATIGWGEATAAARAHKEQVEGQVKAARDYAAAVKDLAKLQSDAQQEQAKRGKLFAEQFANLGGADGYEGLIRKMAEFETSRTGSEKTTVKDITKDDKGHEVIKDVEVTRTEAARRRLASELAAASRGDQNAINRLTAQAQSFGLDTKGLSAAAAGVDADKDAKAAGKADQSYLAEQIREAEQHVNEVSRDYQKRVADISKPLQDRFNAATASGNRIDEAATRGKLQSLGYSEADAAKFAKPVLQALQQGFNADVRERASQKGLTFAGAAGDLLADFNKKQADARENADEKGRRDRARDLDRRLAGTGVDDRARAELVRRTVAGATPDEAARATADALSRELQGTGLGAGEADRAARERVDAVAGRLGDELVHGQFSGQGADKGLSHFGAADFTGQVESAGMEALQKQANELLKGINDKQEQLLRKPNLGVMGA